MKSTSKEKLKFLKDLKDFLDSPITFDDAAKRIARRREEREERFLGLVKGAVFGNPRSPYLPLLKEAGCEYEDLEAGVRKRGLEGALRELKDSGVWISYDEFKGSERLKRGPVELSLTDRDFDNPLLTGGMETVSGGTSGRNTRSHLYLDYLAARACYEHLVFRLLDIYDSPMALWYPKLPASTGVGNSLRYAKIGHPPERWFSLLSRATAKSGFELRLATSAIVWTGRLTGTPLPRPVPLATGEAGRIVDWRVEKKDGSRSAVVQCYCSQALRIVHAAAVRSADISGTLFIVGSEPLTAGKRREIEQAGARVYPRYMSTELGSIALGCGNPKGADDYHLLDDTLALVEGERTPDGGGRVKPFYLTSFIDAAPKIMINMELGDTGMVDAGDCGCLLSRHGFGTHLSRIGSLTRTTAEGMAVSNRALVRIVEEALPGRFGGSPLDYQWVEIEGESSINRVEVRVSPAVGAISEAEMVELIIGEIAKIDAAHRLYSDMWREAGSIRIVREEPKATSIGKVHQVTRAR